jgi:hypothetical protein
MKSGIRSSPAVGLEVEYEGQRFDLRFFRPFRDPGGAPRNGVRGRLARQSWEANSRTNVFFCSGVMAARQPRDSPACKGKSLRCLRKRRFPYIDTSPALSARRDVTAALRYSARPPQRPSRLHLGCQTHQTYCFRTSSEPPRLPLVAWCTHQVQSADLPQTFLVPGYRAMASTNKSLAQMNTTQDVGRATEGCSALQSLLSWCRAGRAE